MNILNVTTIREWRGGDKQMYTIFKLLENEPGIKQIILCPENSVLAGMCRNDNSACVTYKKNKLKLFNATAAIIHTCKREAIDVIHIHDSSALNSALIALKFLPKSTKLILSRKRNNPIKDKFLNRYKYSHPRIEKIVSVSKAVEAIFDNIIKNKDRLLTIYDAIDVAAFSATENRHLLHKEHNLPADTLIVGNIAGLTDQKDLITFIDTAQKIKAAKPEALKIKFIIIGDGPLRESLAEYAAAKNMQNDIIFTGFKNNVAQLLPEFDVFLMTSVSEGLPLTIYEAFACHVPVVSTDAGGIREVVVDNKTGFVTPLKDASRLAGHVLEILQDKVLANTITENAFALVKQNHDLHVLKKNYLDFYRSLA